MEKDNIKELTKLLELPKPQKQKTIMKLGDIKNLEFLSLNFAFYDLYGNRINPYSLYNIPGIKNCEVVGINHNKWYALDGKDIYSGKVTEIKLKIINSYNGYFVVTNEMEGKFGKDIEE